ncbi:MAG TPA: Rieske 2Fe-2S domain-containing protein [Polyangium sp.]|nr:Rieske 2Fe-2S domain-containing protein [Polyangium sp.]
METKSHGGSGAATGARRRLLGKPIPAEGEGGVFTQSWYPVCMSSELAPGKILGMSFLDGRIVVFRGESGRVQALSAYCPHLGGDLAAGAIVGDAIRCAFHHWEYSQEGTCLKTGAGDPPPPSACLFRFPTVERYGMIWAFNGETPLFDLPDFPYPDDDLVFRVEAHDEVFPVDPWVVCCNTPDVQHIRVVHGFKFDKGEPAENMVITDHSMMYDFDGIHPAGPRVTFRVGIFGTTLFYQSSFFNGRWYGYIAPFGMPAPGQTKVYYVLATRKSEGDEASQKELLDFAMGVQRQILADDAPILRGVHFRPGTLTKSDTALARFLEYLRKFPRAHPSAEFIR